MVTNSETALSYDASHLPTALSRIADVRALSPRTSSAPRRVRASWPAASRAATSSFMEIKKALGKRIKRQHNLIPLIIDASHLFTVLSGIVQNAANAIQENAPPCRTPVALDGIPISSPL